MIVFCHFACFIVSVVENWFMEDRMVPSLLMIDKLLRDKLVICRVSTVLLGAFVLLFITLMVSSCVIESFINLESNVRKIGESGIIYGRITYQSPEPNAVIVSAFTGSSEKMSLVSSTQIIAGNYFALVVPLDGEYLLVAFADQNNNSKFDKGEPSGVLGRDVMVMVSAAQKSVQQDFELEDNCFIPAPLADQIVTARSTEENRIPIAVGEVANMQDPRFSAAYGHKGLWAPADFLLESGLGVYFLEPYDPSKIPILFINGAGGSPEDWRYFFDNLDGKRFQAWFFFYPSGSRLDRMAKTLDEIVMTLHGRYHFDTICVTAHSMGGLIARSFILKNLKRDNRYIRLFISLSTPWHGHEAAALGVEYAPVAVPSWFDMVTDSPFQEEIFSTMLTPRLPYYLFFSYRGNRNPLAQNNDGTVTLASQLRVEAQNDAVKVLGFDESHVSILHSKNVFEVYTQLINQLTCPLSPKPNGDTPSTESTPPLCPSFNKPEFPGEDH